MNLNQSNEVGPPAGSSPEKPKTSQQRLQAVFDKHPVTARGTPEEVNIENNIDDEILPFDKKEAQIPPPTGKPRPKYRDGKMAAANDDF